jgi:phosphoglycerate dehydrogenase-like enzyme
MYKIRTYNKISVKGLEKFSLDKYEIASEIGHPNAVMLRSHILTPEDIDTSVKAIGRAGAGVNNIPVDNCTGRGIVLKNCTSWSKGARRLTVALNCAAKPWAWSVLARSVPWLRKPG